MQIPPYLKKGDTIGLLSTARKIDAQQLESTVAMLEGWGLNVRLGASIGASEHQFAGDDALRAANFQQFIDDDSIQAILCARGGYGTMRMIDRVDFGKFRVQPKWICGFSDVTILHTHLNSALGIASIHSSMPSLFPADLKGHAVTESLRRALFGEELKYVYPLEGSHRTGAVKGIVAGGNLSLLYAAQGSVSDLRTDGCILFIEDLDEYLYHIDRMMISLDRAGKLKNLRALIVGGMSDMKDHTIPFGRNAEEIIWELASKYDYPVCFNFPAGHIENNCAIRFGQEATLQITGETVTFIQ
jgi:muramoyltetrapeptide carboxypeptidase